MRLKLSFVLLAVGLSCPVSAAPIISIEPSAATVNAEATFSVEIKITDAVNLYAFEFDLGFDQTALSANSTIEGSLLSNVGTTFFVPGAINNAAGTISFTANTLLSATPGANGNGTLAIVSFTALAPSTSTLSIFNVVLLDSQLSGIESSSQTGVVTVTEAANVIPEPTTIALVGSGLVCTWRTRRGRRLRGTTA